MIKLQERFWSKINISNKNDCWNWNAGCFKNGYGEFEYKGKPIYAHRMSWILTFGEIPQDLFVCHKCDNRFCVNPDHLFLGTQQDNVNDMIQKGRINHELLRKNHANFLGKNSPLFGKKQRNSASKYYGVAIHNTLGRKYWRAMVHVNGKQVHIGNYKTEFEAAEAYNQYVIEHRLSNPINVL